ncbi:MAG: NAD(P)/FAD-dependent oxidoreductase [Deltaproteobacteria bacterium]|jgi:predicted flavoprotein YhiN|nr:NAD(P)/FAD-dependent oxidoreductase [Deltaproteobacteria bacterium]
MIYDFIVLGAGASGLFFAANRPINDSPAARRFSSRLSGGRTLLLEKQNRSGRKLLLSGGGKCNVTNLRVGPENYLCTNPRFCAPALAAYGAERMLAFLRSHAIALEEREHGQVFCRGGAEQVRDLLLRLALDRGAELRLGQNLQAVRSLEQGWCWESKAGSEFGPDMGNKSDNSATAGEVATEEIESDMPGQEALEAGAAQEGGPARFEVLSNGRRFLTTNLLLASGGKAWPRSGASSFGYSLALAAGHALVAPRPALTPLKMPADWPLHGLQGLSLEVETSLVRVQDMAQGKPENCSQNGARDRKPGRAQMKTPSFRLPLLFTHTGLSGPACLQMSSYFDFGSGAAELLQIDFLPGENFESLLDAQENSRLSLMGLVRRVLPERLAEALLNAAGLGESLPRKVAELGRAVRVRAAKAIHEHRVRPVAPDFSQAESTAGGVDTSFVDARTMQSKLTPGLYFSGEVLDVCGQLGGYNLQWAWSSGWLAARAAFCPQISDTPHR